MARIFYGLAVISLLFLISCTNHAEQNSSKKTRLDSLNQQISVNPANAALYYNRGLYFFSQESYKNSISDLIKAVQLDSLNGQHYFLLSDAYLYDLQSRKAVETLEKYIGLKPGDIEALLKLTKLQYTLQQYDMALFTVNEVFKTDLQNAEALFLLGAIFRAKGDQNAAINALKSAVEMDPEIIDAWVLLGDLLAENEDSEALIYYDNALAIDSENITALHSKAFYLQNHNRISDAIVLYEKIHVIDSSYAEAYLNAGILHLELKQYDEALFEFNQLIGRYPELSPAYYYRAIGHELKGDNTAALDDYRTSLRLDSSFQKAAEAIEALESD